MRLQVALMDPSDALKLHQKIEDAGYPMINLSGEGQIDTPDNRINTELRTE